VKIFEVVLSNRARLPTQLAEEIKVSMSSER